MNVSDISTFFQTSTRSENDAINKIREKILKVVSSEPPIEYFEDPEYGVFWKTVYTEWNAALKKIAVDTDIPTYDSIKIQQKGGRRFNYDAKILYYNGTTYIGSRKIEFKNGGKKLADLPQFLSLQVKQTMFPLTYDIFYYEKYLDSYLKCDPDIIKEKPSLESYKKCVASTKYSIIPFFSQLKERELHFQKEKNDVVNTSITDYLMIHGKSIDIKYLSKKIQETQKDKIYLLWSNGTFNFDRFKEEEMNKIEYYSIKNGNVLQLKSGNTFYNLLLRWRNHKGILNPAWQISIQRLIL